MAIPARPSQNAGNALAAGIRLKARGEMVMKYPSGRCGHGPLSGCLMLAAVLLAGPARGDEATVPPPGGGPDAGAAAPAMTESQRQAADILMAMARDLAGLHAFTFTVRQGYDVVQATGQKIEFGETRQVAMDRPDRLRVEEVASDGTRDLAIFDGKTITVLKADSGVFAQAPQPGTVDDALVYLVRDLKLRMPLAQLMTTRLPEELPKRVKTIDYVESTDIYGVPTHHIAGRTDSVDFQFWITEGDRPLPLRVVITYLHSTGQPQFWANFTDWRTNAKFAKDTFRFTPPKDARQIPFAVQVKDSADARPSPAANEGVQP
jgi:hypothetical protein